MTWGFKNRMSRIFKESGNTVMLAVDHGYFQGPTTGLKYPKKDITPLVPFADSLYITRGLLRNCFEPNIQAPVFLRVSGGPSILGELSNEDITTSMKEALRLNSVGVGTSVFVGAKNEDRTISSLGRLVNEAEDYGMPVLGITAVGKEMVRDARYLALASRIIAEMGAHIVKTYYCDDFEQVVDTCPVPIVIAGGKKIPERDALQMARNAIDKGAKGVDMGRNIFQSDSPLGMIKAVKEIVHNKATVDKAFQIYEKEKNPEKI
jgi:3-hydroxy-5-phosphonooxypentane-2,4-dione thiolase